MMLAQGFVLHRGALRDTWERSWATLAMPQQGPRLPVLTLRDREGGPATASLPLHPDCLMSMVVRETAPPLLATPSQVLFGAPASLLPQETYCAFSVVWPRDSVCADEPITPTIVAVFTRDQTRSDIARAVVAKPSAKSNRAVASPPFGAVAALALALLAYALVAASPWAYALGRAAQSAMVLVRIGEATAVSGNILSLVAAAAVAVAVAAVAGLCAWAAARRVRSARLTAARVARFQAWSKRAWNEVATRHHISALVGGQISTIVLGADTVERAEKWRRVFEKAIGLTRCGPWSSDGSSAPLASHRPLLPAGPLPPPPPCPAAMLNAADLWLRGGASLAWQPKRQLVAGRQVWELDGAWKVSEVVEGDSSAVARCLVALHTPSTTSGSTCQLVQHLSDFSDVVRWAPGDGHAYCVLRQWRTDPDGCAVLTLDSVDHPSGGPSGASASLHVACLVVPDAAHLGHGGCPPDAAPGSEADPESPPPRRRRPLVRYRRRAPPPALRRVPASPHSVHDALPSGAAAAEAHAASVAAAAAAAAVSAALPPSCLVVVAGTVGDRSRASGPRLLVGLLGDLTDAIDGLRFAPVPLPAKQGPEEDDEGEEEEAKPSRPFRASRFARRKQKDAAAATPKDAAAAVAPLVSAPASEPLPPAEARALGLARLASSPPLACPVAQWSAADTAAFAVRGTTFGEDRVKVPAPPDAMFDLVGVDLWRVDRAVPNIAAQPSNRVQQARRRGDTRWLFVLQIQVPGPPHFALVCYFAPRDEACLRATTPFGRLAEPFFFGDSDEYRDSRFKLIPRVVEGNFIVRNAVGAKPTILGKKLKQRYHRGANYFELDIDVSLSLIAQRVVGIAYGYAKLLTVDLAMVLQGDAPDELPEVPFAGVRLVGVDFDAAPNHPPLVHHEAT